MKKLENSKIKDELMNEQCDEIINNDQRPTAAVDS